MLNTVRIHEFTEQPPQGAEYSIHRRGVQRRYERAARVSAACCGAERRGEREARECDEHAVRAPRGVCVLRRARSASRCELCRVV